MKIGYARVSTKDQILDLQICSGPNKISKNDQTKSRIYLFINLVFKDCTILKSQLYYSM